MGVKTIESEETVGRDVMRYCADNQHKNLIVRDGPMIS